MFHSLLDLAQVPPPSSSVATDNQELILTSLDRMEFISLLSRMLTLDPTQRITPSAALQMPFISMQHLAMHMHVPVVWDWIQSMQVCKHTHHQPASIPPSTPNCCNHHLHLMTGAATAGPSAVGTIQPPLFYPVVPQTTHLVSTYNYDRAVIINDVVLCSSRLCTEYIIIVIYIIIYII